MTSDSGHTPVLLSEVVGLLPAGGPKVLVDCTVGLGGHAEALLESAGPDARLIGLDVDEENLRRAKRRLAPFGGRCRLFCANFADLPAVLAEAGEGRADFLLADLGVSSSQLADPDRGFAFSADGPLDMRMDRRLAGTAADLLGSLSEKALADLIYQFGQERYSRRIARAVVAARKAAPIERTLQLAEIVARAMPAPARRARRGVHPATRTFQALRIAVNDELASLERLLEALAGVLAPGGRAVIISFHSLEDRRVKRAFARLARIGAGRVLTDKPVTPSPQEIKRNPRSRSAKLRAVEKIA